MIKYLFCSVYIVLSFVARAQVNPMYVGTYTSNGSVGVYVYNFDERTGAALFSKALKSSNPSFLARKGGYLYAVNENASGSLSAFDLSTDSLLNTFSTKGAHPCHVSLSPSEPIAVVSIYSGGSLVMYSLSADGSLNKQEDFIQFSKSSVNSTRQKSSHIHSAFFTSDGKFLFVNDLGGDVIYKIKIDNSEAGYTFKLIEEIPVKLGGGPRHLVINDNGDRLFVVLELTGEIQVLKNDKGTWTSEQIVPMFDPNYTGKHGGADVKISRDGRFLYATNRGNANQVVVYKVNEQGLLSLVQTLSVEGNSPRNVQFSPDENWIIVSNQLTGNLSLFHRNKKSGKLTYKNNQIAIPSAVCTVF